MSASRHLRNEGTLRAAESQRRPSSSTSSSPTPSMQSLLAEHFANAQLGAVLGLESPAAIALAQQALLPPLADFLSRPGKQIRSRLVEHAFDIAQDILPSTASKPLGALSQLVEMLHAGSLIVDDVEDDAIERRGGPALHRTHGLPAALNAGNWLYFWPSLLLSRSALPPATLLAAHDRFALTLVRSHHGQALDLAARVTDLARHEVAVAVDTTTRLKTGSLFELSARLGALVAHATPQVEDALGRFGREVGCVLQMLDDLSSVLEPARLEKGYEDLRGMRPTWVWVALADALDDATFGELQGLAREVGEGLMPASELLPKLRSLLPDEAGAVPRRRLLTAIESLRAAVGDRPPVERLIRDVRALEHVYAHV